VKWQNGGGVSLRLWLVLLFVALLCFTCSPLPAQSLTPTLQDSDPIWQSLLQITQALPGQFQAFTDNLTTQINSLLDSNLNLQTINSDLQDSNQFLTTKNGDLMLSLSQSQAQVETLEKQSKQLQTDFLSSQKSTTKALADAKALELKDTFLRIGCWTFGILSFGEGTIIAGHLLKAW
jgi:hypothetical protein